MRGLLVLLLLFSTAHAVMDFFSLFATDPTTANPATHSWAGIYNGSIVCRSLCFRSNRFCFGSFGSSAFGFRYQSLSLVGFLLTSHFFPHRRLPCCFLALRLLLCSSFCTFFLLQVCGSSLKPLRGRSTLRLGYVLLINSFGGRSPTRLVAKLGCTVGIFALIGLRNSLVCQ